MKIIADLHIHSKYSRATSPTTDLKNLSEWAALKGVDVLGTGDFTHPAWFAELKQNLVESEQGLFRLKKGDNRTRFLLTSEISCIYKKTEKVRKVHILIFAPSLETVEKINKKLGEIGNIKSDGRPILGLDTKELAKIVLDIDKKCFIVPAHIWTPWFAVFGSKSGFDSLEECFDEYAQYIYAVETGLSSDPAMNWRLSQLDKVTLISNSDCHSPQKIGREANVFDTDLSYDAICKAIKEKNKNSFLYTIEFFPEEGKYHLDGHRDCGIRFTPEESKKYNNICPKCKKPLVIGVYNRIDELADRPESFVPNDAIPYKSLVPLEEVIGDAFRVGSASKRVKGVYDNMLKNLNSEFNVLLNVERKELEYFSNDRVAEAIIRVREGKVEVDPGYDGVYGKVNIFKDKEKSICNQKSLL